MIPISIYYRQGLLYYIVRYLYNTSILCIAYNALAGEDDMRDGRRAVAKEHSQWAIPPPSPPNAEKGGKPVS